MNLLDEGSGRTPPGRTPAHRPPEPDHPRASPHPHRQPAGQGHRAPRELPAACPEMTELDRAAVNAGPALPHHNGRTEGVNTRTRRIMRQTHGRAGFSLLRRRILLQRPPHSAMPCASSWPQRRCGVAALRDTSGGYFRPSIRAALSLSFARRTGRDRPRPPTRHRRGSVCRRVRRPGRRSPRWKGLDGRLRRWRRP